MRRYLAIGLLALALGGCAEGSLQNFGTAISLATKSITNPVTRADLDGAEAGFQLIFTGLITYRHACLQGLADVNCRANIRAMQVYTKKVPTLLANARAFVDAGDQVSAITVYNLLIKTVGDVKNEAFIRGVKVS